MKTPFKIKIAYKLIFTLKGYIEKYEKQLKQKKRNKFLKLFNDKESILYSLDESSNIKLYKDSILSEIIVDGFEKKEEAFIKNFLKNGDIFIDIGANIGIHSIFAAKIVGETGKVYSFEPTPITFQRLQENISINNLQNIITPINKGISDKNGALTLNLSTDGYDAWNSFTSLSHINQDKTINVDVLTLDSFLETNKIDIEKIALIKIDIEGWELFALKGAETFLTKNKKAAFLIEYTDKNAISAGYCSRDIYRFMETLGYKWYEFDIAQMKLKHSPIKLEYPYENLIALKV